MHSTGTALAFITAVIGLWFALPILLKMADLTIGLVDGAVWQLLLFSIISFLSLLILAGAIAAWLFKLLGIPLTNKFWLQFKNLSLWQQFAFYWASFALLLLAGIACLASII
ncbi:hypothetical protein [Pedobacter sp. Leaf194]|uniref:hypothetical protein n=1 Tax=Pedobacter sp. Leaf194 TaxID=1736297 RepID=UPI00138F3E58|nr:hypothetical protein [Pedobacter sp. Leaf194]